MRRRQITVDVTLAADLAAKNSAHAHAHAHSHSRAASHAPHRSPSDNNTSGGGRIDADASVQNAETPNGRRRQVNIGVLQMADPSKANAQHNPHSNSGDVDHVSDVDASAANTPGKINDFRRMSSSGDLRMKLNTALNGKNGGNNSHGWDSRHDGHSLDETVQGFRNLSLSQLPARTPDRVRIEIDAHNNAQTMNNPSAQKTSQSKGGSPLQSPKEDANHVRHIHGQFVAHKPTDMYNVAHEIAAAQEPGTSGNNGDPHVPNNSAVSKLNGDVCQSKSNGDSTNANGGTSTNARSTVTTYGKSFGVTDGVTDGKSFGVTDGVSKSANGGFISANGGCLKLDTGVHSLFTLTEGSLDEGKYPGGAFLNQRGGTLDGNHVAYMNQGTRDVDKMSNDGTLICVTLAEDFKDIDGHAEKRYGRGCVCVCTYACVCVSVYL
jgi:hypothetical protein